MILLQAKEMQTLDRSAIERIGIPGMVLMENAGLGTVLMMERELGAPANSFAFIFIGPGNNGGDGFVIGRHLYQRGCLPVHILLVPPDSLQGDALANYQIIQKLKLPLHVLTSQEEANKRVLHQLFLQYSALNKKCYAVIDAIFGIGLSRPVTGHFAQILQCINARSVTGSASIVSVDCPSGLDVNSGNSIGTCVTADYTATYGFAKIGHFLHQGKKFTGKLTVIDIGIPTNLLDQIHPQCRLITAEFLQGALAALKRDADSHKGQNGHLLVLAGSPGKTGAAILCVKGALKSGCGLVSLLAPEQINPIYEAAVFEAMTIPAPGSFIGLDHYEEILLHCHNKNVLVAGPGIGLSEDTEKLICTLYQELDLPMVLDADAITLLARHPEILAKAKNTRIFTPHPGELSRLLNCTVAEIQADRIQTAQKGIKLLAGNGRNILLVKGAGTVIVDELGHIFVNSTGNPGMATGGMGDVLSGIIGSLVGQGLAPLAATCLGAFLHGLAADGLFAEIGIGFTAGEVAENLPATLKSLSSKLPNYWQDRLTL